MNLFYLYKNVLIINTYTKYKIIIVNATIYMIPLISMILHIIIN